MKNNNYAAIIGLRGEALVAVKLMQAGFIIKNKNFTTFAGEIDIIAQQGPVLAFIEVKTRHKPLFDMTELISPAKQKKIITVAKQYCALKNIFNITCRFDVALVVLEKNTHTITIIENAFTESHA